MKDEPSLNKSTLSIMFFNNLLSHILVPEIFPRNYNVNKYCESNMC
jgi:hypothetical protein